MNEIDTLTSAQMVLKAIDTRLKKMERTLAEIQAEVEDTADDVEVIKDMVGLVGEEE